MHSMLQVYGNPLGCVQGVPDNVTQFDTWSPHLGYDKTAICSDNCTEHTFYIPSEGMCIQCPYGTHARGVGALNCAVLSPARCL